MQNQFAVWLAAMFGFTQCTEVVTEDTTPLPETELVGTWVETRTTRAAADDSADWVSTHRKTIIVEQVGGVLRFRNCLDDASVNATVAGEQLTLTAGDYPTLRLSAPDTLTGVAKVGNTAVSLRRVSEYANAVLAPLELTQPQAMNTWTQVCLETLVADQAENRVAFKARNSLAGVTVGLTFTFATAFQSQQYDYPDLLNSPDEQNSVTGIFAISGVGTGALSEPRGTLLVSEGTEVNLYATLTMLNSLDSDDILIDGVLNIDPEWFLAE